LLLINSLIYRAYVNVQPYRLHKHFVAHYMGKCWVAYLPNAGGLAIFFLPKRANMWFFALMFAKTIICASFHLQSTLYNRYYAYKLQYFSLKTLGREQQNATLKLLF